MAVTQVTKANNVSLTVLPSPARLIRENNATYVEIAERKIPIGGPIPPLREGEKHLNFTTSLCPVCM
ncbi:MAG: radical SAM protein, partial [Acidilobus sp.]